MVDIGRSRGLVMGAVALVVAVIVAAFALGGSSHGGGSSGAAARPASAVGSAAGEKAAAVPSAPTTSAGSHDFSRSGSSASGSTSAVLAPSGSSPAGASADSGTGTSASSGAAASAGGVVDQSSAGINVTAVSDSVTATRVVKTGTLGLRVPRGQVQPTITRLTALTSQSGGYVSQSTTDDELGSPTGELTLRIPATAFDTTVTAAEGLGHVTSVTTNARDVTGKFVDLGARLTALQQTRSTYLTILGRARTIGSTLEVQQHVDDVQQQIEELQGELKLLSNQSADGTLTVDVSQVGAVVPPVHHHHAPSGIGHAWSTSVHRFNRGFDSIVGALGPLLLVLLILAFVAGVGGLGYRGIRRAMT